MKRQTKCGSKAINFRKLHITQDILIIRMLF